MGAVSNEDVMNERIWTAALIVIGDEILSGRTHDRNIAQVAGWLQVQGIRLMEVRVVPDVGVRIATLTITCSPRAGSGRRTMTSPSTRWPPRSGSR